MTNEEAITILQKIKPIPQRGDGKSTTHLLEMMAFEMAIAALKAEPCEDAVSRKRVKYLIHTLHIPKEYEQPLWNGLDDLPSVTPKQKLCKDCKFFETDRMENVDGISLIVAHEICNKWGDGCKTKENGYCFLFEPKMEVEV